MRVLFGRNFLYQYIHKFSYANLLFERGVFASPLSVFLILIVIELQFKSNNSTQDATQGGSGQARRANLLQFIPKTFDELDGKSLANVYGYLRSYEVLTETKDYGCSHIVRLKHNRIVLTEGSTIKSFMVNLETMGQTQIEKRMKDGTKSEVIKINFNWQKVNLKSPERPRVKLPCLEETVVHAWGETANGEKIEWFLYTDLEVNSLEDAVKIVQYYNLRWTIEIYHKVLKTGLKAENLQLETAHAIFAAISIMGIVGLRVLDLKERLRMNPEAPAKESGLDELELKVLGKYLKRELTTVRSVALAIGRLGGHQNRKSDGMPGVLSLWWGMSRFLGIMEGVRLATS